MIHAGWALLNRRAADRTLQNPFGKEPFVLGLCLRLSCCSNRLNVEAELQLIFVLLLC